MNTMEQVWNKIKWRDETEQVIKNWYINEATESQRKELLGYYNVFTVVNLKQMCREQHLQLTHCGEAPNKIELCYMLVRGKCYGYLDFDVGGLGGDSEDETDSHLEYGAYKKYLINIIKHSKYYKENLEDEFTSHLEEIKRQVYKDFIAEKGIDDYITPEGINYELVEYDFYKEKIEPTLP